MRRLLRGSLIVLMVVIVLIAIGYWSGSNAPIDVVADAQQQLGIDLRSSMVPTNGIRLHVVEAGPVDGPPVVMLHGFPEFWWGWNQQIVRLAKAGFHVIVPDLRGYDLSDKPAGVEAYRLDELNADVLGMMEQLGHQKVYLAAHDWGGAIAWRLVIEHPEHFYKLAMFNSPHPVAFREAMQATDGTDESVNWFRTFFQLPWVPEIVSRFGNWRLVGQNVFGTARPGAFSDRDVAFYKQAWSRPGAYEAMINWYRAGFRYPRFVEGDGLVRIPVLIVWGMQDRFFEKRLLGMSAKHCPDVEVIELPEATHWLLHEEPERTSQAMIEFFRPPPGQ